ncbi:MAG: oligopeptide/dipeptide ABC transporter ATP-binding protein, partial [Spirochaetota bacterium]|nr:oligopeptide/dipeptide ABC transporter ATP-binding protein [Spirochaetota bacterium]
VYSLFENPSHPYTQGLLNSLPSNKKYTDSTRLEAIKGTIPDLLTIGNGCPFENRCLHAMPICHESFPEETKLDDDHSVWCHFVKEKE